MLRLEAEVEAFVMNAEETQHIFSGDMSSYEVSHGETAAAVGARLAERLRRCCCAAICTARAAACTGEEGYKPEGAACQPCGQREASGATLQAPACPLLLVHQPRRPALPTCLLHLQRLLAHRTAQHWGLETSTVNHGPEQGRILAIRTPSTKPPQVCDKPGGWYGRRGQP